MKTFRNIRKENNNVTYFLTLDNRERPFAVFIHPLNVRVYNLINKTEIKHNFYYQHLFIGKSDRNQMTTDSGAFGSDYDGNSILLHQGDNNYLFIGQEIYSFQSRSRIVEYHSPIGNNLVPYPYAKDKRGNTYLMIEKVILKNANQEPYELFYRGNPKYSKLKTRQISSWLQFY